MSKRSDNVPSIRIPFRRDSVGWLLCASVENSIIMEFRPLSARMRVNASGDARGVDMTRDVSHATLTVALAGTSFSRPKPKDLQLRIYLEVFVVVSRIGVASHQASALQINSSLLRPPRLAA